MSTTSEIRIAVAAHKPYWMPDDPMYTPVQAGAAGNDTIPGFQRDDGGMSISKLNPHLCELTVLYWAWKNLEASAIGLVHYRRQFAGSGERGVLTAGEAETLLTRAPVIVPRRRNYYIETVGNHYDHTFEAAQLDLLIESVAELAPKYVPALYRRLSGTQAHMFNMLLMRRDVLNAYCEWMFPIVAHIESALDYESMTPFEARTPGRLSEYLLDTWIATEGVPHVECPVRDMEPVNWVKKGGAFLAAKFFGRKYQESF